MEASELDVFCILQSCIFYAFGVKWCYEYARQGTSSKQREDVKAKWTVKLIRKYGKFLGNQILEGSLKLVASVLGLIATFLMYIPYSSPILITMYVFFAFSGLVDILNFYFPRNIGDGLVKITLAQSFFIEGLLFPMAVNQENFIINIILVVIAWMTSIAIMLEVAWPEIKLMRALMTLIQGGWIAHMFLSYNRISIAEFSKIILILSWHVAAAFVVTLCIVAVTKWFIYKMILSQIPKVPIYDICQQSDDILS